MTMTTLIIIIGLHFPYELKINFEDEWDCYAAMDNFYMKFYRKQDRKLTLPPVKVSCKALVKQSSVKGEKS